jgi:hypothetical protein
VNSRIGRRPTQATGKQSPGRIGGWPGEVARRPLPGRIDRRPTQAAGKQQPGRPCVRLRLFLTPGVCLLPGAGFG